MLRHLKNANELILYASISCGLAFVGRIYPAFWFPIFLLRLGVFLYCVYVIAKVEKNKELAMILGGALFLGMLGGYWDLVEVYLRFNSELVGTWLSILGILIVFGVGFFMFLSESKNEKTK